MHLLRLSNKALVMNQILFFYSRQLFNFLWLSALSVILILFRCVRNKAQLINYFRFRFYAYQATSMLFVLWWVVKPVLKTCYQTNALHQVDYFSREPSVVEAT